jgi:hypothetical protein
MCRLRVGRPATRAASCSAADCGRTASPGSVCIGSIMRAPSYVIDHHRNQPSLEPILPRTIERRCFCGMLVAVTTDPRRAALARVPWLADSDPRARSALHTPKRGQNRPCTHASPESVRLRSLSERLTLITAVTSILLLHGRLRAERNEPPWYSRKPKVPPLYPSVTGKTQPG